MRPMGWVTAALALAVVAVLVWELCALRAMAALLVMLALFACG